MKKMLMLTLFSISIISPMAHEIAQKTLEYTNEFRVKNGLPALKWNQALADAATKHSQNMADHKVTFGHDGFKKRIATLPVHPRAAAENVYMCNYRGDIARSACDGWIKSPGHLKNIRGNYNSCGIGVYKNKEGFWYVTQIFGFFD